MKILGFTIGKKNSRKLPKIQNRGRYRIVDGSQYMIDPSSQEFRSEDEILDPVKRAKLLDITRNLVRNSSLFNTILGQMTTNVVGTTGGKIVLSYKNDYINDVLKRNFYRYTRNTDFYNGDSMNRLLKRVLREYVIGGDVVLVFDDGLVENSGKVLLFESSEIVNVDQSEIEKRYGRGSWISNGKVYNPNGRHIGTVVSKSQRGQEKADPNKCYFLRKDPDESSLDSNWFHFSCNWREGRGVSQAASAIGTIHQLEDLVSSELLASRRNSQLFCWLTSPKQTEEQLPSAFDELDLDNMTDAEIEEAAKAEMQSTQTISFNRAKENSIVYEALPEGYDAKQLQTTHPNTNVQIMVDFLANRCAASMGLSKVYATGNPSDSDWRANQLFAYPAILEMQKDLEKIADWIFFRFCQYIVKQGVLEYIDPEIMDYVSWTWKGIDDLDPVEHQNGIRLALENNTQTYRDILGADWKDKLSQIKDEITWFKDNGLLHPSMRLLSGGESSMLDVSKVQNED